MNQGGEAVLFIYKFSLWRPEATLAGASFSVLVAIPLLIYVGSGDRRGNIASATTRTVDAKTEENDVRRMHIASKPLGGAPSSSGFFMG